MGTERGAWWLLSGILITLGVLSCLPVLTGAPCSSDDNCPLSQHCVNGRCEVGRGTGGGSGEAVRVGVHELRCDDGLDDDADGVTDCVDPDCEGFVCKGAAGACDLPERCLAGVCPADGFELAGVTCRPVVGECDLEERCTGGPQCPSDLSRCPTGEYCEPTGCVAQRALAAACTADVQCLSGSCVDGVCCDTRCEGACDGCATGTCTPTDAGVPGRPSCAPFVCNGTSSSCPLGCTSSSQCVSASYCAASGACLPRSQAGAGCASPSECVSGFCVDGTCCEAACTGACEVCNAPEALGRCIPSPAGATGDPSCAPYVCGGSSPVCPSGCTADLQCASGLYCGSGRTCVAQLQNGATCSGATQCLSGHCVEGRCCSSACDQACDTCAAGTCVAVAAASAGSPACAPFVCDGSSASCPTVCSGNSDCANGFSCVGGTCGAPRPNGQGCTDAAQCASRQCVDGYCCNTACAGACDVCNATPGTCTAAPAGTVGRPSCSGYLCNGTQVSCPSSCTGSSCAPGYNCTGGTCVSNGGNGASCTGAAQCTSGNCVGGVCCNSACAGACDTCETGTCSPVSAGAPGSPSCAPYLCNGSGTACPSSCTSDRQCASGSFCQGGRCVARLANGAACSSGSGCASGQCADGVCCNTACTGACNACDVSGSVGTCLTTAGPGEPSCAPYLCNGTSSGCPLSCGSDAHCIASSYCSTTGACRPRRHQGESCTGASQCTSGFCVDGVCCGSACGGACDTCGGGTCRLRTDGAEGVPSCAPYRCDGTSASCPSHCSGNSDCAASNTCVNGACVAGLGLGASCTSGSQCGTGNCVDGVCCSSSCGSACASCNQPGALGTCTPHAAASDPENGCGAYTCDGAGACRTTCAQACGSECKAASSWCNAGACVAKRASGTCADGCECASGFCADGVCCDTACVGACVSCALSGSAGTCTPRPAGADPENGCGGTSCDGAGACLASCSPPGSCPAVCGPNGFCTASGVCGPTLLGGESCTAGCQCASDRCTTFFPDADGDGYGQGAGEQRCGETPPLGYATRGTDCDDGNAQVHPGVSELPGDEVDSDCDGEELCYRDDDGDGFRLESTRVSPNLSCADANEAAASVPAGDCCDADADVHPGQTAYFATERTCGGLRYDYDCDGVQTRQWTQVSDHGPACSGAGGETCVELPGTGWLGPVPDCGRHEDFSACVAGSDTCSTVTSRRDQSCR